MQYPLSKSFSKSVKWSMRPFPKAQLRKGVRNYKSVTDDTLVPEPFCAVILVKNIIDTV